MKLYITLALLSMAAIARAQDSFREIDPEKPYLTELGQFAARQMSTKSQALKLMNVQHAEQADSLYKLKLTLQRNGNKNDIMYCTVEIDSKTADLSLQNYGCTLPALVRRRRPQVQKVAPEATTEAPAVREAPSTKAPTSGDDYDILSYPYGKKNVEVAPVTKTVGDDESSLNDIESEPTRKPKRHAIVTYVRQPVRVSIPARMYAYGSRPLYQVASQPIVYRLQPAQYHQYQSYQPYYQPYYRTIAY